MNDAARALIELISEISEEWWAARWMAGIEYELYAAVFLNDRSRYVQPEPHEVIRLRALAAAAGGWPRHRDHSDLSPEERNHLAQRWSRSPRPLHPSEVAEIWYEIKPFSWFDDLAMEASL